MAQEINIAEILRDKPKGTKLYSPACGKCCLEGVEYDNINVSFYNPRNGFMVGGKGQFCQNGRMYDDGECMLYPSKDMRDWNKFAWKKGDVLVSNDGSTKLIFNNFIGDDYVRFTGIHSLFRSPKDDKEFYCDGCYERTDLYTRLEDENERLAYVDSIEAINIGKLNPDTLKFEKPSFKDGDVIHIKKGVRDLIAIFASLNGDNLAYHVYEEFQQLKYYGIINIDDADIRLATEEEKEMLLDALKEGCKRWNPETKRIEDIDLVWTPQPFEKVLVRNKNIDKWKIDFFSHKEGTKYFVCASDFWNYCIPYNAETSHLVGTADDYKQELTIS